VRWHEDSGEIRIDKDYGIAVADFPRRRTHVCKSDVIAPSGARRNLCRQRTDNNCEQHKGEFQQRKITRKRHAHDAHLVVLVLAVAGEAVFKVVLFLAWHAAPEKKERGKPALHIDRGNAQPNASTRLG
jgi:hypothetical protein